MSEKLTQETCFDKNDQENADRVKQAQLNMTYFEKDYMIYCSGNIAYGLK